MGNHISRFCAGLAATDDKLSGMKRKYEFGCSSGQLMGLAWVLDQLLAILKRGGLREIEVSRAVLRGEGYDLDENQVAVATLGTSNYVLFMIKKINEIKLSLVSMAFVHAFGDIPVTGEAFRDAIIRCNINGFGLTSMAEELEKSYRYGITYTSISNKIEQIENKKLTKFAAGFNLGRICKFGVNCRFPNCKGIHHWQWNAEEAKENQKQFDSRKKQSKNQNKKNKKNKKQKEESDVKED